jgi:hypothetical protein
LKPGKPTLTERVKPVKRGLLPDPDAVAHGMDPAVPRRMAIAA